MELSMKSTIRVPGHLLLFSLVRSHHSLIRLLHTARFAHALRCAHLFACSLARSLTHSLSSLWERFFLSNNWMRRFHTVSSHCAPILYRFNPLSADFIQFQPTVRRLKAAPIFRHRISIRGKSINFSPPICIRPISSMGFPFLCQTIWIMF